MLMEVEVAAPQRSGALISGNQLAKSDVGPGRGPRGLVLVYLFDLCRQLLVLLILVLFSSWIPRSVFLIAAISSS